MDTENSTFHYPLVKAFRHEDSWRNILTGCNQPNYIQDIRKHASKTQGLDVSRGARETVIMRRHVSVP